LRNPYIFVVFGGFCNDFAYLEAEKTFEERQICGIRGEDGGDMGDLGIGMNVALGIG
jgi:hypothetical protein